MESSKQIFIHLGHQEIVESLLKAGADVDRKINDNYTLLVWAARNGNFKIEFEEVDQNPRSNKLEGLLLDYL